MEFGRLGSWEQQGNRVYFTFEKGTGRLEVITDRILNVFSGVVSDGHRSKAIEGEKAVETRFCVSEDKGVVTVATDCVTAKVHDGFFVDFYRADGTVLCRDRREARKARAGLSDELKALKEAEGHSVEEEDAATVQVVKRMEGGEAFYGLDSSWCRLAVGTRADNERLVEKLRQSCPQQLEEEVAR